MIILDQLNARGQGTLPGLIGIEFTSAEFGRLTSRLTLRPELLAPNGYLHAAAVIALADTTRNNKLTHEYFGVNTKVIWRTVQEDLPVMIPLLKKMLQ